MAEQRNGKPFEELTPDTCIDFAAGLLSDEERAEVLRLASASPRNEELLRSVMGQAETARSAAASAERFPARKTLGSLLAGGARQFLDSLFGTGRLVPAMAGASLLLLGLLIGAGTVQLLQTGTPGDGTPARLISLFPSPTRAAGPAAAISAGSGLYIELNGIQYPCEMPLLFDLADPSGRTLLQGRLYCQPETGEWAGLFLPGRLLAEAGDYRLRLETEPVTPGNAALEALEYRFSIQ